MFEGVDRGDGTGDNVVFKGADNLDGIFGKVGFKGTDGLDGTFGLTWMLESRTIIYREIRSQDSLERTIVGRLTLYFVYQVEIKGFEVMISVDSFLQTSLHLFTS